MSRIPRVRTWRVAWYVGVTRVDVAYVEAPTKILARLNLVAERPDLVCRKPIASPGASPATPGPPSDL